MLAISILRYDKKSYYFKRERLTEILQAVRCHIYDCINNIYQFFTPFLDNKMPVFEECRAFKKNTVYKYCDFMSQKIGFAFIAAKRGWEKSGDFD